jgi:probable rRNA maturation factor
VLLAILEAHGAVGTLGVAIVDDGEIRRVHREFLGKDTTTDVISFRLDGDRPGEHDTTFGEVVVSVDTALREARRRKLPPDRELALYAIHGTLHLVGFDDHSPADRRRMRRVERRYLEQYDESAKAPGSGPVDPSANRSSTRCPRKRCDS